MAYGIFARHYDALTTNVKYSSRAMYFDGLIQKYSPGRGLLLDLACGTGSLSVEMAKLGYEVIGVDASADMLSVAMSKNDTPSRVMFLNQPMQKLNLYGTVDAVVCALDSLNHLAPKELKQVFERLRLFVAPGGVFVFDVNTKYKHQKILADNCFVYENNDVYCVWQNNLREDSSIEIILDFFENCSDGTYKRHREEFCEYIHEDSHLRKTLTAAGFEVQAVFDADTENPPAENSERVVYIATGPRKD